MPEQNSGSSKPGFFKRLGIAAIHLLVPVHTGLIVFYFVFHALSGSDLWFIDALGFVLPLLFIPSIVLFPLALWYHHRNFSLLAAIPPVLFIITYGHLYMPRLLVSTARPTLTVMAHNALYSNTDADQIIAIIETHQPDVMGFSELNISVSQELVRRISGDYPYYYFDKGYGIFSRYPIHEFTTFEMSETEWSNSRAQKFVLDFDGHRVTLIHAHPYTVPIELKKFSLFGVKLGLPLALNNSYRDADVEGVLSKIEQVDGPLIVMGDFNLTDQQNDYKELTRDLLDAHRESGWGLGLTFTRFRPLGIPMWRIDYVFHSSDMVALHTTLGDFGGSDHKPVIVELGFIER